MLLRHTIESAQMSLCLIPKILNAIDVVLFIRKQLTVINAVMLKLGHIQGIVTTKSIGIDDAIGLYFCRIIGSNVSVLASGITTVKTLPCLFRSPNTGTLPLAPRPRLPLRLPPK